jgi:hypothetical protein
MLWAHNAETFLPGVLLFTLGSIAAAIWSARCRNTSSLAVSLAFTVLWGAATVWGATLVDLAVYVSEEAAWLGGCAGVGGVLILLAALWKKKIENE